MNNILALMATDHLSGPARQLVQLSENINKLGSYRYCLCFAWPPGMPEPAFFGQIRARGIDLHVLDQKSPFDLSMIRQLQSIIRNKKIDLVQTHGYKPNVLGCFLQKLCGIPWVAYLHGDTMEDFKLRCYFLAEKLVIRQADIVITVSHAMRNSMVANGGKSVRVHAVHNAIDPDSFQQFVSTAELDNLRRVYGISKEDLLVGIVGRLSQEKGHEWFLKAFQQVLRMLPKTKAIFIGSGPEENRLRKACMERGLTEQVLFVGFQENMATWYNILDLVVMPSLSEGLPNVAMEAMLFSKPVVATKVGGIPEVVEDGITGKLINTQDVPSLAAAIESILSDEAQMRTFGINGRKRVLEAFTPAIRANRIAVLYDGVLEKN